jgi:hypothetical protein
MYLFRLPNFRTPIRNALRTTLAHTIKLNLLGFSPGGLKLGRASMSGISFRSTSSLERQNARMRAEIDRLSNQVSINSNNPVNEPMPVLNCLQKSYRANKSDFNPRVDSKPVFSSSYSVCPAATTRSGGLRGGAARGGRKGRL